MRILYFSRGYTVHDKRFLAAVAESPNEIHFLQLERINSEPKLPVGVIRADWAGTEPGESGLAVVRHTPAFEAVVKQVQPDVVHAGPIQSCGFIAALSRFSPLLLMSWGSDLLVDADRDIATQWLTRFALSGSDMLLTDCDEVTEKAKDLVSYPSARIVQFPWGVDIQLFSPGPATVIRQQLGWENRFVLLFTRSWETSYGVLTLLDSFKEAVKRLPNLRLLLVGDGSLRGRVREFISANGLAGLIHTPGIVPNEQLPAFYREADVYVSCSVADGTSVSLLEAMACGLPVIVTDRASNREWVTHDINGWLFTFGDVDGLTSALVRATGLTTDQRERICAMNRSLTERRANWPQSVGRLLAVYSQLLQNTSRQ